MKSAVDRHKNFRNRDSAMLGSTTISGVKLARTRSATQTVTYKTKQTQQSFITPCTWTQLKVGKLGSVIKPFKFLSIGITDVIVSAFGCASAQWKLLSGIRFTSKISGEQSTKRVSSNPLQTSHDTQLSDMPVHGDVGHDLCI